MDPLTMMIASIGMQFFNHYANNEINQEIQAQQREFQDAALKHHFERMRKAQVAAAKLALELEAEFHAERMQDIEDNYNTLLASFAHSFTISDWPINVLPFIMKGESFGTLFGGTAKSINMHCILTPSNCAWFNDYFYDDLDLRVEAEMNNNWNAQSTHPIVYYGGGWNRREKNSNERSIPSLIDLNDIDLLKTKLEKIPTMVITPYFNSYLHFKVQLWGMGKDLDTPFIIDIPHGDIEPSDRIFSYDYHKDGPIELSDDFFNTTIEEFVPYLTCLIGFVADKYFWSMYSITPILPKISKQQAITKQIFKEKLFTIYKQTLKNGLQHKENFLHAIDYVNSLSEAISMKEKSQMFSNLYKSYISMQGGEEELNTLDLKFLNRIQPQLDSEELRSYVTKRIVAIHADENVRVWFCANKNELYQRVINESEKFIQTPSHFIMEYRNDVYAVGCFVMDKFDDPEYSEEGIAYYTVLLANKNDSRCITIDVETLQESEIDGTGLFSSISFDEQHLNDIYNAQSNWLHGLCEMTESSYLLIDQLEGAPVIDFTYQNLRDWIEENACQSGEANVVMGFRRSLGRYFYIVSGSACTGTFACYCNTIDDTMRDKFNNKHILTIKVN